MNYLEQIVAFSRWKKVHPLPGNAIALWLEFMATCNEVAWEQDFTVSNAVVQALAGLSRKEFEHARQLLISMGRITYRKSTRVNQAGIYTIIPIPCVQKGQQEGQRQGQQEGQRQEHSRGILFKDKLNETKIPPNPPRGTPEIQRLPTRAEKRAASIAAKEEKYRDLYVGG